jgi:hypothetical protein
MFFKFSVKVRTIFFAPPAPPKKNWSQNPQKEIIETFKNLYYKNDNNPP